MKKVARNKRFCGWPELNAMALYFTQFPVCLKMAAGPCEDDGESGDNEIHLSVRCNRGESLCWRRHNDSCEPGDILRIVPGPESVPGRCIEDSSFQVR
ncbi:hypothetical protein RUM44_001665 [Polyplax serrata]|uniref:Uncharacterized protein n=1 Tax=Polyplax serrata TaxID=468196 RepID=A0ABR1AMH5_POLSC